MRLKCKNLTPSLITLPRSLSHSYKHNELQAAKITKSDTCGGAGAEFGAQGDPYPGPRSKTHGRSITPSEAVAKLPRRRPQRRFLHRQRHIPGVEQRLWTELYAQGPQDLVKPNMLSRSGPALQAVGDIRFPVSSSQFLPACFPADGQLIV